MDQTIVTKVMHMWTHLSNNSDLLEIILGTVLTNVLQLGCWLHSLTVPLPLIIFLSKKIAQRYYILCPYDVASQYVFHLVVQLCQLLVIYSSLFFGIILLLSLQVVSFFLNRLSLVNDINYSLQYPWNVPLLLTYSFFYLIQPWHRNGEPEGFPVWC